MCRPLTATLFLTKRHRTDVCSDVITNILHPWEVYKELKAIKSSKASGPDGIPPKLIKEFAYELSSPLTDVLNCSFREGVVPHQ